MTQTKKKLAILGGGMGALSAAYWLTSAPGWQDRYDVTLYQMGWRLGGKAASSRNPNHWHRNEEHGYHMLFGFYENTFKTMRACYQELGRSPDAPISAFIAENPQDEVRHPHRYGLKRNHLLFLAQEFNGSFQTLTLDFPANDRVPGEGAPVDLTTCFEMAWQWLWKLDCLRRQAMPAPAAHATLEVAHWWADLLAGEAREALHKIGVTIEGGVEGIVHPRSRKLYAAGQLISALPAGLDHQEIGANPVSRLVIGLIRGYLRDLWSELRDTVSTDWDSFCAWVCADLVGTIMIGVLHDDLFRQGFESINHLNYYEWLRAHSTVPEGTEFTVSSVLVQFAYDACFAYRDGDEVAPPTPDKPLHGVPDMEAGTLLRGQIRLLLTYKGSVDWLFQAGAGEVLVAPVYEVLRRRGVRFKFFHKVSRLVVSPGSTAVDAIEMEEQVKIKVGEYQPLVIVKDVPAWPSEPLYDQLADGDALRASGADLESFWTDWRGTPLTLKRGVDFDDVLLGISIGAFPYVAADLIAASPAWRAMTENVKTTRTIGFQTWMSKTLEEMGWTKGKILTGTGVGPVNMEADATQIIERENWPVDRMPVNLTYFGGVMKDDPDEPPAPNPSYPPTQAEAARKIAVEFMDRYAGIYWPHSQTPGGFRWEWLVNGHESGAEGHWRFDQQFWRANIDPSERYVLSVVGSSRYRLPAGGSGFDNLYLAGDWIKTGLDCGCMEATVMSGMQASRALCGYPAEVAGEHDFGSAPGHRHHARIDHLLRAGHHAPS